MKKLIFANNASSTLSGALAQGATTCVMATGSGSIFPSPSVGFEKFKLTLFEKDVDGNEINVEVVDVGQRTSDTLFIDERDSEGLVGVSGGYSYPTTPGATVYAELRWTKESAEAQLQSANNLSDLDSASIARENLGLLPEQPFTPTLSSSGSTFAYASRSGYYVRHAGIVFFRANIILTPSGTTLGSSLLEMALPVPVSANAPTGFMEVQHFYNMASATGRIIVGALFGTSRGVFQIQLAPGTTPFRGMNANDMTANSSLSIAGFYFV